MTYRGIHTIIILYNIVYYDGLVKDTDCFFFFFFIPTRVTVLEPGQVHYTCNNNIITYSPLSKNRDSSCDSNFSSWKTVFSTTLDGCPRGKSRGFFLRLTTCSGASFTKLITDCDEIETKESTGRTC